MSLVEAGSLVGGVIGSPVSLDMRQVDGALPSTSKPPSQQSTMMGRASGPPIMNRSNVTRAGTSYSSSGAVLSW